MTRYRAAWEQEESVATAQTGTVTVGGTTYAVIGCTVSRFGTRYGPVRKTWKAAHRDRERAPAGAKDARIQTISTEAEMEGKQ